MEHPRRQQLRWDVEVHGVDLDHHRDRPVGIGVRIVHHVPDDSRGRQDDGRGAVADRPRGPFVEPAR